jgi:hypothetical protein
MLRALPPVSFRAEEEAATLALGPQIETFASKCLPRDQPYSPIQDMESWKRNYNTRVAVRNNAEDNKQQEGEKTAEYREVCCQCKKLTILH